MRSEFGVPKDGITLKQYVVNCYARGDTKSERFKALVKIYGREKLESWWKEYKGGLCSPNGDTTKHCEDPNRERRDDKHSLEVQSEKHEKPVSFIDHAQPRDD